jgi:hypothetical protein
MKTKLKQTMLIWLLLLGLLEISAQTVGTSSTNPIIVTTNTTGVGNLLSESPDGTEKWYKFNPADSLFFVRVKLNSQGYNLSLVYTDLIVVDGASTVLQSYRDSLVTDSIAAFAFNNFDISKSIYLKLKFSGACSGCTAPAANYDLLIYESKPAIACPVTTVACNIVKNPSFESYTMSCSAMALAVFDICDWKVPSSCANAPVCTTDYFNNCWTWGMGGMYSGSHTGAACVGLHLYANSSANQSGPNNGSCREYIQQQLTTNLTQGKTYQVSMWVKGQIFTNGYLGSNNTSYFIKDLSVFFSATTPCQNANINNINTASYTGQNISMSNSVMTNTVWQKYVSFFSANGSYNKITIGNFNNNANTTTSLVVGSSYYPSAYYNIDDVSVFTSSVSITSPVILACPSNTFQFNPVACEFDNTTYSYSWSPSFGLSNPNILNPVVNINTTMVYTLTQTGTNSFGTIVNTATVAVNFPGNFILSAASSSPVICQNLGFTTTALSASANNNASFVWQPGNLSGANVQVSPTVNTIYTVAASYSNCAFTKTVLVTISNNCCDRNGTPVFPNFTVTANTQLAAATVFNNDVTVAPGTFLTLSNAEYIFAPGVKIIVSPGAALNIYSAHLYACSDMWQGIVVQAGGRVVCTRELKDNLIEDAVTAIDASNQTGSTQNNILNITYTTFNRNDVSIKITNYRTQSVGYPFYIARCVFTCRNLPFNATSWPQAGTINNTSGTSADLRFTTGTLNALAPPFLGQTGFNPINLKNPLSFKKSSMAIVLDKVGYGTPNAVYSIKIGDGSQTNDYNVFDSHTGFILATNSNLNSFNNVFQSTIPTTAGKTIASMMASAAIRIITDYSDPTILNTKLDVVCPTNPSVNINRFYDCHTGIDARNQATVNIKYVWMSSTQSKLNTPSFSNPGCFGISVTSNRFYDYQIHNSKFMNLHTCMFVSATSDLISPATPLTPSSYGQTWGTFSITANFFCPATATSSPLTNEFIANGIYITSGIASQAGTATAPSFFAATPNNGLRIMYNNFYKVWTGVTVNGLISNGYQKVTANNSILLEQNINPATTQWGINHSLSSANAVNSNTVTGFTTATACIASGIYMSQNLTSAVKCNHVLNLPRGFEFAGTNAATAWGINVMFNNSKGMLATNWGTGATGGIGQQGGLNSPSDNFWQGQWGGTMFQTWTDANSNAANSKIYNRSSPAGYPLVQSNNNGIPTGNSYNIQSNRPSATGAYGNCPVPVESCPDCGMRQWIDIAGDQIDWSDPKAEINQFLLYLALDMDSLLKTSNDTLADFYEDHAPIEQGKLQDIENVLAAGDYSTADELISGFTPETNIQENYLDYFKLYYRYRVNDSLVPTDSLALLVLANQCPFSDGPAVYKARSLYSQIYMQIREYNDEECVPEGYSLRNSAGSDNGMNEELKSELKINESKKAEKYNGLGYRIFPNPTKDAFRINSFGKSEIVDITITDITGKIIFSKTINVNGVSEPIALELTNGIYFVNLIKPNKTRVVKKLVID